jgi:hypothetical protein
MLKGLVFQLFLGIPKYGSAAEEILILFKVVSNRDQAFFHLSKVFQKGVLNFNLVPFHVLVLVLVGDHFFESGDHSIKNLK